MDRTEVVNDIQAEQDLVDGRAGLVLGELENLSGFVLRIAQLTAFDRFFEQFPPAEIRISEFTVLMAIHQNPGARQGVLADVLKIKWPNMTKLVRALEESEWIVRHIPPNDRRSVELRVTEKGLGVINKAAPLMYDFDRQAFSMLDDTELQTLTGLLRKVAGWSPQEDDK